MQLREGDHLELQGEYELQSLYPRSAFYREPPRLPWHSGHDHRFIAAGMSGQSHPSSVPKAV